MTPLTASLVFIIVSILIGTIKHFIFPSNSPSTTEESSIQLKKIYTITDKKAQKTNKSYRSFFQAYHQFHIEQIEERKQKIEETFMLGYNSLVMKKSIINDESVIICEENYLAVIQEGIACDGVQELSSDEGHCDWWTTFNVYELPLLKQNTKKSLKIKGRLVNDNIHSKHNQKINKLICKKQSSNKYSITFPLSTKNQHKRMDSWVINKVIIEKYNTSDDQFQFRQQSMQLQDSEHNPTIYSTTTSNLCYAIESQPWLIKCKTNTNQNWQHINIMEKQTQKKVYQGFSISSRTPPFSRIQKIEIKHMFLFESVQNIYEENCEMNQLCKQSIIQKRKDFVTVVYEHINNPYRVEKFYVQLTFQLDSNKNQIDLNNINSQNSKCKLTSHSLLISELSPSRIVHSDCSLSYKKQTISEHHYEKYYWLYEQKVIAQVDTHSLLCVFRFDIDEYLRIAQISDVIRSKQVNHYYDLNFFDWRNLKKIINYKENFQLYLLNQSYSTLKSNNNTQGLISPQKTLKDHQHKQLQNFQQQNQINLYLEIIKEEIQTDHEYELIKNTQSIQNPKSQKKKTSKSIKTNKSKSNKRKTNKKKEKSSIKNSKIFDKKYPTSPLQGAYKPSIQTSYNYSFYRQTYSSPIRSEVRKYKFPLPFLLSFTQKMEIVNPQPSKPLILFSGVKQYLFTYQLKQFQAEVNTSLSKVVDYRYLTLGQTFSSSSKIFSQNQGTPQHQIQTSKTVIDQLAKNMDANSNQKITVQIEDETHPEVESVIKTIQESNEKILNQIQSIKSVPVIYKKLKETNNTLSQPVQSYQRYLIVVWGWGIEVYLVDWDKNGFFRQNITQQEIEIKLSQKNNSLIEYFLPFIELFATFYCIFQALISSR